MLRTEVRVTIMSKDSCSACAGIDADMTQRRPLTRLSATINFFHLDLMRLSDYIPAPYSIHHDLRFGFGYSRQPKWSWTFAGSPDTLRPEPSASRASTASAPKHVRRICGHIFPFSVAPKNTERPSIPVINQWGGRPQAAGCRTFINKES